MGGAGYELLEHPADVGIHAWGATPEAAFEQAGWGLVDLLDIRVEGTGDRRTIALTSQDRSGLLVDFLNELLFLHDSEGIGVADVRVLRVTETELEAEVETAPVDRSPEGTVVKAATYHRLRVEQQPDAGADIQVFLDV